MFNNNINNNNKRIITMITTIMEENKKRKENVIRTVTSNNFGWKIIPGEIFTLLPFHSLLSPPPPHRLSLSKW